MQPIVVENRYHIFPDQPLTELNTGRVEAFAAHDSRAPYESYYALKCDIFPPPRTTDFDQFLKLPKGLYINPLWGKSIPWPDAAGQRKFFWTLFLPRPQGERVMPSLHATIRPWTENHIIRHLIPAVIEVIDTFESAGLTYRALRPDNIFYETSDKFGNILLGECLSVPSGYYQGVLFETIDRGMAAPFARGPADISHDLYALGVTIVILLLGHNPFVDMDDSTLLTRKIEMGSYGAIAANRGLSVKLNELIRGLLADNSEDRWKSREIQGWLNGAKMTVPHQGLPKRASRPFDIHGKKEAYTARTLGYEFRNHPADAAKILTQPSVEVWLKNSAGDHLRSAQVSAIKANPTANLSSSELLMHVLMILDSEGPLTWGNKTMALGGIEDSIIASVIREESLDVYSELIMSYALSAYMVSFEKRFPELERFQQLYPQLKRFLEIGGMGYGIERCLYTLSPRSQCYSPLLIDYAVYDVDQFLMAYEEIVGKNKGMDSLIDGHALSFLACRWNQLNQADLRDIHKADTRTRNMIELRIFSSLQEQLKVQGLPNLCQWFAERAGVVIDGYHNLHTRRQLKEKVAAIKLSGNLKELLKLLDNPRAMQADAQNYHATRYHMNFIQNQIKLLEDKVINSNEYALKIGARLATNLATFLSIGFLSIFILIQFFK